MPQTLSQKIIALYCGREEVRPGELIKDVKVDIALGNDITTPLAIRGFEQYVDAEGKDIKVWDNQRVVLVLDHFTPNKDIKSAEQCKMIREFARKQSIRYFFEGGGVYVIAPSFARIFYRNAFNIGLMVIECAEAEKIQQGDNIEVLLSDGVIRNLTRNEEYRFIPIPKDMQDLVDAGGLMPYRAKEKGYRRKESA